MSEKHLNQFLYNYLKDYTIYQIDSLPLEQKRNLIISFFCHEDVRQEIEINMLESMSQVALNYNLGLVEEDVIYQGVTSNDFINEESIGRWVDYLYSLDEEIVLTEAYSLLDYLGYEFINTLNIESNKPLMSIKNNDLECDLLSLDIEAIYNDLSIHKKEIGKKVKLNIKFPYDFNYLIDDIISQSLTYYDIFQIYYYLEGTEKKYFESKFPNIVEKVLKYLDNLDNLKNIYLLEPNENISLPESFGIYGFGKMSRLDNGLPKSLPQLYLEKKFNIQFTSESKLTYMFAYLLIKNDEEAYKLLSNKNYLDIINYFNAFESDQGLINWRIDNYENTKKSFLNSKLSSNKKDQKIISEFEEEITRLSLLIERVKLRIELSNVLEEKISNLKYGEFYTEDIVKLMNEYNSLKITVPFKTF